MYMEEFSFDCCKEAPVQSPYPNLGKKKKQETDMTTIAMNVQAAMPQDSTADNQRRYLLDRLDSIRWNKRHAMEKAFGLEDDDYPQTAEDFLKRIKDGRFKLSEENRYCRTFHDRVRWRDPETKEDTEGFEAAKKVMDESVTAAKDQILIMDPKDGLLAMQTFEASEFK